MILVTFAVPQESREFVARLRHAGPLGPALVGNLGLEEVAVVHTGMGAEAARTAIQQALAELHPARVIASGFAGGLDPALAEGELIIGANFSDSVPAPGVRRVRLISVAAPIEQPGDKARLRFETGADAIDLESAAVAEACAAAHTPLLVLRIISDTAREALPLPTETAYDFTRQRVRPLAILRHLQRDPAAATPLVRFAHRLPMLQRVLADALAQAILPRH